MKIQSTQQKLSNALSVVKECQEIFDIILEDPEMKKALDSEKGITMIKKRCKEVLQQN